MKRIKQHILFLLIVVTCIFMPLSCIPILFIMNSVNPMQLAFITEFTVENQSGEHIEFTPVGTWGKEGNRSLLPIYRLAFPSFRASKTGNYPLAPGESKDILYDWDDINFSEIAVRTDDNRYYQLVIDSNPTERQYHSPVTNWFVIPPIADLEKINPRVFEAVQKQGGMWNFRLLMAGTLVLPFILWGLIVAYKKEERNAQPTTQPYGASASTPQPPVS